MRIRTAPIRQITTKTLPRGSEYRGPGGAQRQRVRRGEEAQRSDCAFRPKAKTKDAQFATTKARRPLGTPFFHIFRRATKDMAPGGTGSQITEQRIVGSRSAKPTALHQSLHRPYGRHLPLHKGGFGACRAVLRPIQSPPSAAPPFFFLLYSLIFLLYLPPPLLYHN